MDNSQANQNNLCYNSGMDQQTIFYLIIASMALMAVASFFYALKIAENRSRVKRETDEALVELTESFKRLHEEIEKQAAELEKKEVLSLEEQLRFEKLRRVLDNSEFRINKEVKDIKKELE